jgi:hypothetical protein
MNRQTNHRFALAIDEALRITRRFHRYTAIPDFLCGVDPRFAGLHRFDETDDGRSYGATAHCVYPHHQLHMSAARRRTTIVLPEPAPPWVIVHEYGHALHEALNFDHDATPVTAYAQTNRFEAFAEAFTAYFYRIGYGERPDLQTLALLDELRLA